MAPVATRLGELLGSEVPLAPGGGGRRSRVGAREPRSGGDVAMLENLRFEPGGDQRRAGVRDLAVRDGGRVRQRGVRCVAPGARVDRRTAASPPERRGAAARARGRSAVAARRRSGAPVRGRARRREGERQARRDRGAARTLRHDPRRRRDGLHVRGRSAVGTSATRSSSPTWSTPADGCSTPVGCRSRPTSSWPRRSPRTLPTQIVAG